MPYPFALPPRSPVLRWYETESYFAKRMYRALRMGWRPDTDNWQDGYAAQLGIRLSLVPQAKLTLAAKAFANEVRIINYLATKPHSRDMWLSTYLMVTGRKPATESVHPMKEIVYDR